MDEDHGQDCPVCAAAVSADNRPAAAAMTVMPDVRSRRGFLGLAGAGLVSAAMLPGCGVTPRPLSDDVAVQPEPRDDRVSRRLALVRKETGDEADVVFRVGRDYDAEALDRINFVLRDIRSNEMMSIDVGLIEFLYDLQRVFDRKDEIIVLSGYRTPKTNAALRRRTRRAAKNSLHMTGKAADLRMPGIRGNDLRLAALGLKRGGVGFYARSNFVHVDTGPLRTW